MVVGCRCPKQHGQKMVVFFILSKQHGKKMVVVFMALKQHGEKMVVELLGSGPSGGGALGSWPCGSAPWRGPASPAAARAARAAQSRAPSPLSVVSRVALRTPAFRHRRPHRSERYCCKVSFPGRP